MVFGAGCGKNLAAWVARYPRQRLGDSAIRGARGNRPFWTAAGGNYPRPFAALPSPVFIFGAFLSAFRCLRGWRVTNWREILFSGLA